MATTDLKKWGITENVFASKGKNDQVPYSDALLFAPDCAYKNGRYYLYYCQPDWNAAEGVAISISPTGPFTNGQKMNLAGIEEIDPCVFVDDDGQAYYIWGQFNAKMAKLKPNMTEIDSTTIRRNVVTEKEHFFHEGGYLVKRNATYFEAELLKAFGYQLNELPTKPEKKLSKRKHKVGKKRGKRY